MEQVLYSALVIGALGIVFGLGLGIASTLLAVKEDNRIEEIAKLLPGYNCGACGFPGCSGLAGSIVEGEAKTLSVCKPGKIDVNFEPIMEYLKTHPNEDGSIIKVSI